MNEKEQNIEEPTPQQATAVQQPVTESQLQPQPVASLQEEKKIKLAYKKPILFAIVPSILYTICILLVFLAPTVALFITILTFVGSLLMPVLLVLAVRAIAADAVGVGYRTTKEAITDYIEEIRKKIETITAQLTQMNAKLEESATEIEVKQKLEKKTKKKTSR